MEIEKRLDDNTLTVILRGRLDTSTAPSMERETESLDNIENLILDLEKLEYISSAGLRIILKLQKIMDIQGKMVVRNVSDYLKELFYMTGFNDILTIE